MPPNSFIPHIKISIERIISIALQSEISDMMHYYFQCSPIDKQSLFSACIIRFFKRNFCRDAEEEETAIHDMRLSAHC